MMLPSGAGASPVGGSAFTAAKAGASGTSTDITLVTGDVVHWFTQEGKNWASVTDDGDGSTFETVEEDGDTYIIPSEVADLVGTYLDRQLFNVSGLVKQGYTDAKLKGKGTPVILQGAAPDKASKSKKAKPGAAPGVKVERTLSSINSVSGTISKAGTEDFGDALTKAAADKRTFDTKNATDVAKSNARKSDSLIGADSDFATATLPGIEKVWLDQRLHATLEESVPQTGAPTAWAAGYDGTGQTIAVLDTGIDTTHPDVASKIAVSKNFSTEASVEDGHGHGTHVASTAAGTGAASNGLRKGVAPGAKLAIGKVMDDNGSGESSAIIAGMEWAAAMPDVSVISMSLGGGASDGTDPMSQALNKLTADTGKLFVVAAGNDGPGASTLGYPSTAEAALAVGAVDKQHNIAPFSSRGPRMGDGAIKPEISAPGVGIKAARAKGTSIGTPVDDKYTALDGTSMATPHVSGAVAILKQEHPDWTAAVLKSALVSSATPKAGVSAFQQGGGELNLATAIKSTVMSTPSTLNMGSYEFPHQGSEPVTKKLTYTNHGTAASTFKVAATNLADSKGTPAPAGMVTVSPATLTLAPGASADVNVTLNRALGGEGQFSGSVETTATDGTRLSGTPFAFTKAIETVDLTIKGIQRNGKPSSTFSTVDVLEMNDRLKFQRTSISLRNGEAVVKVPRGTYNIMGSIMDLDDAGKNAGQSLVGNPVLKVTANTTVTIDARQAKPITVKTPSNTVMKNHTIQYNRPDAKNQGYGHAWIGGAWPLYAKPTAPVTLGKFDFASTVELGAPGEWWALNFPEVGRIPSKLTYKVTKKDVASVNTTYAADEPVTRLQRALQGGNTWNRVPIAVNIPFTGPVVLDQYYTPGPDTTWRESVNQGEPGENGTDAAILYTAAKAFTAGEKLKQSWFQGPRTPGLRQGNDITAADLPNRVGNTMNVVIPEWGDSNSGAEAHYGPMTPVDTASFEMYRNGTLYASGSRPLGSAEVPSGGARWRFDVKVARNQPWWTTSTKTHTQWEFDSGTTTKATPLPLLTVKYVMKLDAKNTAIASIDNKGPKVIGLDVGLPRTAEATKVTKVKAWLSYDDGKTWVGQTVKTNKAGKGTAPFEIHPQVQASGYASIKVEATDNTGNTITQEVTRAYKLAP